MAQLIIPVTLGAEEQIWRFMNEQSKNEDRLQSPQATDRFLWRGSSRTGAKTRLPALGQKRTSARFAGNRLVCSRKGGALVPVGFRN
jgi:hypothetical protein